MSEKVAPEGTVQIRSSSSRRSSLSEIADKSIQLAGSGHRSSIAGRRKSTDPTVAMIKPKPLGCGVKSAYSLPRLVLSGFDYTIRPARVTVYREAFGMPIMTMSMLVSICKSLDFLLGFLVGKLSDSTRTRWGRRKPWIAAFSPLFIVVTLLLASPGLFFSTTADKDAVAGASTCAGHATKGALNCTALKQCLDVEIAAGSLPAWDSAALGADGAASASSYSTGLAVYFATLYFMHYVFGWTASMIPYDALGMELTSDYDDKTSLFGTKAAFQFLGYILHVVVAYVFYFMAPDDIQFQVQMQGTFFAAAMAVAVCITLAKVKERPMTELQLSTSKPVVPSMRAMFSNKPYMMYLLFNVPFKLAALIPVNLLIDYLKFNAKVEAYYSEFLIIMVITLLATLCSIPVLIRVSKHYGKKKVLVVSCIAEGIFFILVGLVPPELVIDYYLHPVLGIFVGVGMGAAFTIPDAILADIVDYDELHTGLRNEGLYSVVENNLQQYVEIIGGVVPGIVAGLSGFVSNGGCSCGCGTACPQPYLRWSCEAPVSGLPDIGYACSSDFTAEVLYGDVDRIAPCTVQTEGVQWTFRLFFAFVPGVCYLLAAIPASRMTISKEKHEAILEELFKRDSARSSGVPKQKLSAKDPLTGKTVRLKEGDNYSVEHFSSTELKRAAASLDHDELHIGAGGAAHGARGSVRASLRGQALMRLSLWFLLVSALIAGMVALKNLGYEDAFATLVTIGCLACAGVFVLIAWDGLRLREVDLAPVGAFDSIKSDMFTTEVTSDAPRASHRLDA